MIISHLFPPAPGVGGRRWAKFAKLLSRKGHDIFVLAAENIGSETSEWIGEEKQLTIEYLPYRYPRVLVLQVKSLMDKLFYRFNLIWLKIMDRGNYYDRCIFWESQIQEKVETYIRTKQIDTVIVTGGPFRLVYYVTKLKPKYSAVKFVSDFRDLWVADSELSALSGMSGARRRCEKQYERSSIENSDLVLTVSDSMKNYFAGLTSKNKCFVIPNGFDPEDVQALNKTQFRQTEESRVRIVFAGTVYRNLDYLLRPFFDALKELREKRTNLYANLCVDFYGTFPAPYHRLIAERNLDDVVKIHSPLSHIKVSEQISQAHYCLLLLNDSYNFSFSTKFCEYVAQRKKIIVVSSDGPTSQYIVQNNLGRHVDRRSPYSSLEQIIERVVQNKFEIETNENFDATDFSLDKIVNDLEILLLKPQLSHESV